MLNSVSSVPVIVLGSGNINPLIKVHSKWFKTIVTWYIINGFLREAVKVAEQLTVY